MKEEFCAACLASFKGVAGGMGYTVRDGGIDPRVKKAGQQVLLGFFRNKKMHEIAPERLGYYQLAVNTAVSTGIVLADRSKKTGGIPENAAEEILANAPFAEAEEILKSTFSRSMDEFKYFEVALLGAFAEKMQAHWGQKDTPEYTFRAAEAVLTLGALLTAEG